MEVKEKTLKLIEYELINAKLVNGLNDIGLNADMYLTDISELIFESIGLESDEELFYEYNQLIIDTIKIDVKDLKNSITQYSDQIYCELENMKTQIKLLKQRV